MTHHTGILPEWLRVAWIVALCVVALLHTGHMWAMNGRRRYWHAGHVLMALGMVYMYLPHRVQPVPAALAMALFGTATVLAVVVALVLWSRDRTVDLLWLLIAVEMSVMAYMFVPAAAQVVAIRYGLAAYLAGVGALWVLGRWDRHYLAGPGAALESTRRASPALRLSLATMAAGMSYMLVFA
ncbi:DUF5134 domain-containing protein [Amycolatopsis cihanbeyliensis]|nr:DUF5134 domain-containing protein [Amycolatopsis cihanbeyliensis]